MKHLTTLAALLLLAVCGGADEPPKKASAAGDELQQFQGTWQVESWEEGGKALAAADLKARGAFFGANVFIFRHDEKVLRAGTLLVDAGKAPRTVDLSVREGEGKGDVMLGIYARDGDTLKICFDPKGQTRPEDFKPDAKAGCVLVTLKKPKPVVAEVVDIVGKYRSEQIDGQTGKKIVTEVTILRRGDGYTVTYRNNDDRVLFIGTALRRGDQFSMAWVSAGQAGVSVYKIEPGPKLAGDYTILGGIGVTGRETLTPWKKLD